MKMTDIVDLEEAFTKSGAELFKELYRVYPVADPEDYFKGGQWKNEMMKTDLMLTESHRRECGAPDVPDLEDIKVPNVPSATPAFVSAAYFGAAGAVKPLGVAKPAGFLTPTAPVLAGAAVGASTPVVEIRLIALFVAKWKLEPVMAKTLLAKLTSPRRRYVIQNFKPTTTGAEASKELETYIAQCEEDNSWDTAVANGTPAGAIVKPTIASPAITAAKAGVVPRPAVVAPNPAVTGLKRPLTPAAVNPAAKRPVLSSLITPGKAAGKGF